MMGPLVGAVAGGLIKTGYDRWKQSRNEAERRQFLDYSLGQQYGYYLKSLRESPSAQREGLEAAGYNPMLTLGSIGGSSFNGSGSAGGGGSDPSGDIVSSAKQGSELGEEIVRKLDEESKQRQADTEKTKTETDVDRANIKKIEAEVDAIKESTRETQKRTWLDNPIVAPVAGALGAKAAEKLGGLFGGSANSVSKAPVVKAWKAAAKKGVPLIGSKMLQGLSLPLLFGSATIEGYRRGSQLYPEYNEKVKKTMRKQIHGFGLPTVY